MARENTTGGPLLLLGGLDTNQFEILLSSTLKHEYYFELRNENNIVKKEQTFFSPTLFSPKFLMPYHVPYW